MKLRKVTKNDPMERLAVSVHQSTVNLLAAYQSRYKEIYGEDITTSHLVEEMLREYMMTDKDFMKAQQSKPASDERPQSFDPGTTL